MAASIIRPYHTLEFNRLSKNSARKKCKCCPYGYHIDVDFVRYCETISSSQLLSDIPVRKTRWNVRKRRASKETLLGIAGLTQLEADTTKASQEVGDDLQKAVLDFEQVLISSLAGKSLHSSDKFRDRQPCKEIPLNEDLKKCNTIPFVKRKDEYKLLHSINQEDFDGVKVLQGMNNSNPQMLQAIRKQMATSLGRMKQLEEEVKVIPNLQAHISNLEEQNNKLNDLLLKKEEELKKIAIPKTVDVSTGTNLAQCHTRNVGVGCSVITREISINSTAKMISCGTDPHLVKQLPNENDKLAARPCLISLENILGNSSRSRNVSTSTDHFSKVHTKDATIETELKSNWIITEDDLIKLKKQYEDDLKPKLRCNKGLVTELKHEQIYTKIDFDKLIKNNLKEQQIQSKKISTSNASQQTIDFNPQKREYSTQTNIISNNEIGILAKVSMADCWTQIVKITKDIGTSNHTTKDPCFNCNVKKINVGIQSSGHNKQEKKQISHTTNTDTSDLIIKIDQGINTIKKKLVNRGVDVCTLYCKKCNEINLNLQKLPEQNQPKLNRPSHLPLPVHNFNKTKIQTTATTTTNKKLRNEDCANESGSDEDRFSQNEGSPRLETLSTFHPIQNKPFKKEPSKEMKGALKVLNDALQKFSSENFPKHMRNAINIVQQEWFKVSSVTIANPLDVEDYLDCFEEISSTLLEYVVNMTDVTGNTAMHYAVSNGNFDVVSILLDSKVCNINKLNTAGYTCIMLVALTKVKSETDKQVVKRLFQMADVNIRAKQHGQTALMLAVSHGRIDTVELLLECGADINIQDEDGSTALMCAAEHGYIDIVKLLLTQPDCDLTITDYDGSTALAIAMDAGNRDIGVLLYAQEHFSRGGSPFTPGKGPRRAKSATPTLRSSSPIQSPQNELPQ